MQPPPRRATPPATTWPFAALGVLATTMLIAAWVIAGTRDEEPGPQPTVIASVTQSTAEPTVPPDDARAQAEAVDTLLASSEASRDELAPALEQLEDCRNLAGAMSVVATVRDERDQQRGIARSLATSQLPDGDALKRSLIDVFNRSYEADMNYLAWGEALQSRGCSGSHTSVRRWDSETTLATRTQAKSNLIRRWNAIAGSFGLPLRKSADI